jgi:hypothetical protein
LQTRQREKAESPPVSNAREAYFHRWVLLLTEKKVIGFQNFPDGNQVFVFRAFFQHGNCSVRASTARFASAKIVGEYKRALLQGLHPIAFGRVVGPCPRAATDTIFTKPENGIEPVGRRLRGSFLGNNSTKCKRQRDVHR